jgi:hypothetical protein
MIQITLNITALNLSRTYIVVCAKRERESRSRCNSHLISYQLHLISYQQMQLSFYKKSKIRSCYILLHDNEIEDREMLE